MANGDTRGTARREKWPQRLMRGDDLYSVTNLETGTVEYLIYVSAQDNAMYVRDNASWWQIGGGVINDFDDPKYSIEFVDVDFIDEYDALEREGRVPSPNVESLKPTTAAAGDEGDKCPPATLDIAINLKNRKRAIAIANYGPLNPKEPNDSFWNVKAKNWDVTPDEAKKSLCGNCVFFVITSKMRDCIASGLESGGSSSGDAWDAIDAAELGFCEAFDFKCAASRTCDAWAVGGPITDDVQSGRGK